ncbi:MAG: cytochrome c [Pirellulales bacterium]
MSQPVATRRTISIPRDAHYSRQYTPAARIVGWFAIATLLFTTAVAQAWQRSDSERPKRALPPKWNEDLIDVFFPDAREQLVGERPASLTTGELAEASEDAAPGARTPASSAAAGSGWSGWISAAAIEDEVKANHLALRALVESPVQFKGGGYKQCRTRFSVLAVMLQVAARYDGQVRWQDHAAAMSDQFARAGFNCKVGTDPTYREASLRVQDLEMLVRGERVTAPTPEGERPWHRIADRAPLMRRVDAAFMQRIRPHISGEPGFRAKSEEILHEAQILALLAEIIHQPGYEYSDDEDFQSYARMMRDAAVELTEATRGQDFAQAAEAAIGIETSCVECHDRFRG